MIRIGVQTKGVVGDTSPREGFRLLKKAGFSCADFSLNAYLTNTLLYQNEKILSLIRQIPSWRDILRDINMLRGRAESQLIKCICLIQCMFLEEKNG